MSSSANEQSKRKYTDAKPFLKWAGGKSNLLTQFDEYLPSRLKDRKVKRYIEPFVGGGALFLHIARYYPVQEYVIADINPELYIGYQAIKYDVPQLCERLEELEWRYKRRDEEGRKEMFYQVRELYNAQRELVHEVEYGQTWVERAAQLIFLNHTCFNGLFRVNSKGFFNVPFGRYKNPRIWNPRNLKDLSLVLQDTLILHSDFEDIEGFADENSFVYFDPPYRPISKTSSFAAYARGSFNDDDQRRLAQFAHRLHNRGVSWMLSNSDPKNENPDDHFFEEIFGHFTIERVTASRKINSNAKKRGRIREILVNNQDRLDADALVQLPTHSGSGKHHLSLVSDNQNPAQETVPSAAASAS